MEKATGCGVAVPIPMVREQAPMFPEAPSWALDLLPAQNGRWSEASPGFQVRTLRAERFSLASVICQGAAALSPEELTRTTERGYGLLREQLLGQGTDHLVRAWNFIPKILSAAGELQHRYMAFNLGRFAAYETWFRGRASFDRVLATASGVGHLGEDLVIHGLASAKPGKPIENPRQIPAYRYSAKYGPLPPCFARATRIQVGSAPWLLVGGTASVRGEDTMHAGDLRAQWRETTNNLASVVAAGVAAEPMASGAGGETQALHCYRHLRIYYPRAEDERAIERWTRKGFVNAAIELRRADLCREGLLVEIEGVAELWPPLGIQGGRTGCEPSISA